MFLLFPIGHDRSVFGLPYLTLTIIAACTFIFFWTWRVEYMALADAERAGEHMADILTDDPTACVDFSLSGLPDTLLDMLRAPQCAPGHVLTQADRRLISASHELIRHVNRVPTLRMGYRPGSPSIGTLFANTWLHGGLFHLIGNMAFLLLAGSVIESFWGPWRFLVLYMLSGIAGTLLHHAMNLGDLTPLIGASGAISGLLGAFVVLYPRTRVQMGYLIWFVLYLRKGVFLMPAWAAIPLWAGQQLVGAAFFVDDGVAYGAHIGGFAVGVLGGIVAFALGFAAVPEREERTPAPPRSSMAAPSEEPRAPGPTG